MPNGFVFLLAFLFGASVGSFVNVCIYRLPRRLSIVKPPSHCPYCGANLSVVDLVPLLSYLWLLGKCRHCKTPISPRYFVVELLTALSFLACFERFKFSIEGVLIAASLSALLVIAFVDWEFFLVPDEAVWALGIFGFTRYLVSNPDLQSISICLGGAFLSGFIIWFIGVLGKLIFRKEAMGFGDVKIAAAVGAHLGATWLLLPFFLFSVLIGAIMGLAIALLRSRSLTGYIPFGPALALSAGIVFLSPPSVINFVLRLYQIPTG
ncbi:MAG: prepilin peptidase [Armatimonadetes bacterium]|nr:prepilin peptidase [Armatimonadota bacterium]MDW8029076.1 prepilin peptidase [Armatimonadota bacterium]